MSSRSGPAGEASRSTRRGARLPGHDDHISPAQHELASARVRAAGLKDRVRVELCDYREVDGTYDAIVSIEMLEAVGAEYFETFFEACDRALAPGGKMSLQTITFPDVAYEPQRRGANWIQTYIFPGGLLPSLAVIERAMRRTNLLDHEHPGHRRPLRPDAGGLAAGSSPSSIRSAPRASTSASSGCGSTTSP